MSNYSSAGCMKEQHSGGCVHLQFGEHVSPHTFFPGATQGKGSHGLDSAEKSTEFGDSGSYGHNSAGPMKLWVLHDRSSQKSSVCSMEHCWYLWWRMTFEFVLSLHRTW